MIDLPDKALIGVIHLPPLPGGLDPSSSLPAIIESTLHEARVLCEQGFNALILENFGDTPFVANRVLPHTVALMTRIVTAVANTCDRPVGVNVLRNDGLSALAIAAAGGARFIRVNILCGVYATDQGLIEGQAARIAAYRQRLCPDVSVFADVHVKHAQPLNQPDIVLAAEETALRGGADALIVSGTTTGRAADLEDVRRVKHAAGGHPVFIGSGVTADNVKTCLEACDGVIVGSCLKQGGVAGRALDAQRSAAFIARAR